MAPIPADRDKITLDLIDNALKRGVTWAALAEALQVPDKRAAKRRHRELKRAVSLHQTASLVSPPPVDVGGLE